MTMPPGVKSVSWLLVLVLLIGMGVTIGMFMNQRDAVRQLKTSMLQRESDAFIQGTFAATHYLICQRDVEHWPTMFALSDYDDLRRQGYSFISAEVDCDEIREKLIARQQQR